MKNTADFDISILIYIILAVVAGIASIFQKKNQQQQKEVLPESDEDTGSFDEEYEGTESQSEKPFYTNPIPQPVVLSQNEKDFRAKSMETYVENEKFMNTSYEYVDEIKATEIGGPDEKSQSPRFDIDLKNAIIYSEIIHRKY